MKTKPTKSGKPIPLKEETIRRIVNKMPGGLQAFCKHWGWMTFARRIERAHGIK